MVQQFQRVAACSQRDIPDAAKKSAARILVVDDERLVRWAVAETLGARGYEVSEAGDAKSALQMLGGSGCLINLVLLDLFLPDACDLRVLKLMRALVPAIPVILMTAFATPDIIEQTLSLGALVVTKPFDMPALAAAVDRTLAAPLS